jgi:hypothetical protein
MIKTKHKQAFLRSKASPKQTYYTDVRKHEARLMLLDNKIHSVQNLGRHSRTRTDRKATKPSVHHRPREKCPSGPHAVGYLYQTACMHACMQACTHAPTQNTTSHLLSLKEIDGQLELPPTSLRIINRHLKLPQMILGEAQTNPSQARTNAFTNPWPNTQNTPVPHQAHRHASAELRAHTCPKANQCGRTRTQKANNAGIHPQRNNSGPSLRTRAS